MNKYRIFYFTGTGNSLFLARQLALELGDAEVTSIPSVIDQDLEFGEEAVGIVFPVYCFGIPLIISRFIRKLPRNENKYYFALCNAASLSGGAIPIAAKEFKQHGLKLSAGFITHMPSNFIPFGGAEPEKKQRKKFAKAENKLKQVSEIVRNRQNRLEKSFFLIDWVGRMFGPVWVKGNPKEAKKFRVDDKCDGCGVCVKVCPVDNIELAGGKPEWGMVCEQCLACLQWCPQEAIQIGKCSDKRKRYHHPDVKLSEMFNIKK